MLTNLRYNLLNLTLVPNSSEEPSFLESLVAEEEADADLLRDFLDGEELDKMA